MHLAAEHLDILTAVGLTMEGDAGHIASHASTRNMSMGHGLDKVQIRCNHPDVAMSSRCDVSVDVGPVTAECHVYLPIQLDWRQRPGSLEKS